MSFKTLSGFGSAELTEKKSRFIGSAMPVQTEQEALSFIAKIKAEQKGANHNVFGYVVEEGKSERYSDDGEPSGTAGVPVLEVIKKEKLCKCVVVVTRYFGGTLLGAGGLVRAYGAAARDALHAAKIVTMKSCTVLFIVCDYTLFGTISNKLEELGATIKDVLYEDRVKIQLYILSEKENLLVETITEATNAGAEISVMGTEFHAT